MPDRSHFCEIAGWFRGRLISDVSLRVEVVCQPLEVLCGDYVGVLRPRPDLVLGVVADACGHGARAAAMLEATGGDDGDDLLLLERSPAAAIERAAARIHRDDDSAGAFITTVAFALDLRGGELRFAIAGHPPPLILKGGQALDAPWSVGLPLGIAPHCNVMDNRVTLDPGDSIALFTDGVMDTLTPTGERLGLAGARDHLARSLSAPNPIDYLLSLLTHHGPQPRITDDTTALFLRRGTPERGAGAGG